MIHVVPKILMLTLLELDTMQATAVGAKCVAAKAVWFVEHKCVVSTMRFGPDPVPGPPIAGEDHLSICKPKLRDLSY